MVTYCQSNVTECIINSSFGIPADVSVLELHRDVAFYEATQVPRGWQGRSPLSIYVYHTPFAIAVSKPGDVGGRLMLCTCCGQYSQPRWCYPTWKVLQEVFFTIRAWTSRVVKAEKTTKPRDIGNSLSSTHTTLLATQKPLTRVYRMDTKLCNGCRCCWQLMAKSSILWSYIT